MKYLTALLVLVSTSAFAGETTFYQGSDGKTGMIYQSGKNTWYESGRDTGMGTQVGNTMYWQGRSPGGAYGRSGSNTNSEE